MAETVQQAPPEEGPAGAGATGGTVVPLPRTVRGRG